MSSAASPCPGADPADTAAPPTAQSQLAGIRELVRIAELQAQGYAQAAAAKDPVLAEAVPAEAVPAEAVPADPVLADPASPGTPRVPAVPRQAAASAPESSAATRPA